MKKVLFLFAFAFFATAAFATEANPMKPVVKSSTVSIASMQTEVTFFWDDTMCMVCAECRGETVCAYASDCLAAGQLLMKILEQLHCNGAPDTGGQGS